MLKNNRNQGPLWPSTEGTQCDSYGMIRSAEDLQRVVMYLDEASLESADSDPLLFGGRILAGPILMTLAVEIALKALLCQEQKKEPPPHSRPARIVQRLGAHHKKGARSTDARLDHVSGGVSGGSPLPARIVARGFMELQDSG